MAEPQPRRLPGMARRELGVLAGLLALSAVLAALSPRFLDAYNLLNVVKQSAIHAILAFGMTFVILTGGIDLSVGSVLALAGAVCAGVGLAHGMGTGVAAGLLVGLAAGLANGLAVTRLRVPPFIATLAMLTIARGATLTYTGGRPITGLPEGFRGLADGELWGLPAPAVLTLALFVASWFVLGHTVFGRQVYAVGSNADAAYLAGIPVDRVRLAVYVLAGLFAAVAGIVLTARLDSAQPTAGTGYELDAIAAVVLGGTSLSGGAGSVTGTLIGNLIIAVLNNGLNLLNVPAFYQQIAKGVVILLAVVLDRSRLAGSR